MNSIHYFFKVEFTLKNSSGRIYFGTPHILTAARTCPKTLSQSHFSKNIPVPATACGLSLTLEERFLIARHLDNRDSFKAAGADLGRDCTMISKEVRSHKIYKKTGAPGRAFNNCAHRYGCDHRRLGTWILSSHP